MRFRIPWSPVGFRVELDGGQVKVLVLESLDRPVVDIGVGDCRSFREGVCIHGKPMVLGGDEDPAVLEPHRLVCPRWPNLSL